MSDVEQKRGRGRPPSIDWNSAGLGEEPDAAVAERLGVPRSTVSMARKRLRIPAFDGPTVHARLEDLENRVARLEGRSDDENASEPDP